MRRLTKKAVPVYLAFLTIGFGTSMIALADHHGSKHLEADIVDVATSAGTFTTLTAALDASDLTSTLRGAGPFTVFAPTDEAFAKLPAGTVDSLLLPENRDQLLAVLTYHVVPGNIGSAEVVELSEVTTVNGSDLDIVVANGSVRINDATVVKADVQASNGLIHVIDAVLLP